MPKFNPVLKVNGIFEETVKLSLSALPDVVDDIKVFNGKLQVLINNLTYDISNLRVFKQFSPVEVDPLNRVIDLQEIDYKLTSYKHY